MATSLLICCLLSFPLPLRHVHLLFQSHVFAFCSFEINQCVVSRVNTDTQVNKDGKANDEPNTVTRFLTVKRGRHTTRRKKKSHRKKKEQGGQHIKGQSLQGMVLQKNGREKTRVKKSMADR